MADTRYLKKRRQGWYFRIAVPRDLREAFQKDDIVVSLNTRDLTLAQEKRWGLVSQYHEEFRQARAALSRSATDGPDPREIFKKTLEDARRGAYRTNIGLPEDEEEDEDDVGLALAIDQLSDRIGPEGEPTPSQRAMLDALGARQRELRGEPLHTPARYRMPFAEAAAGYLRERQRDPAVALTKQTEGQEEAVFRLFADFCRNKPISQVTARDSADFISEVGNLDPQWGRSPATKQRSLRELRDLYAGKGRGLSNRTLNRYSRSLAKVWRWAKKRGEVSGDNPFEGLALPEAKTQDTGFLPFSVDQLNAIFAIPADSLGSAYAHEVYWVPRIAVFSGMRVNEICSLSRDDVRQKDGVWYFDITKAKSDAGVRPVPIHSALLELGLIDALPTEGSAFPALKPGGPDGKLSWYFVKRFTELRRRAGAVKKDAKNSKDRLSFHSFRKNVVRCLELARVPQTDAAEIVGHEKAGLTYRVYNPEGLTMRHRQEIVEKIAYSGLKLPEPA